MFILLMYVPTWILTRGQYFRLDTDYDALLPLYYFLVDFVRHHGAIPTWNPYIGTGIPVLGDPLSAVANPILTGGILLFGVETGVRLTIGIIFFLAALSMWWFLSRLHIRGWLRVWGSLLFASAGNMIAYIRAGHIPELLVYPAVPMLLYYVTKKTLLWKDSIVFSLLLAYVWYSGYTYMLWFVLIFLTVSWLYYSLSRPAFQSLVALVRFTGVAVLFVVFSWPKTYEYINDVGPNLERVFTIDPYAGSIHSIWFPLGWVMPLQAMFYDRPFFQRMFGFYYNWYEYYAFITPFPFFFLVSLRSLLKKPIIQLFLVLLVSSALYIALRFSYSPFYWIYHLVPFARTFRVPQRIYEPSVAVIIALLVLCAKVWFSSRTPQRKKLGLIVCIASLVGTSMTTQYSLLATFESPRTEAQLVAKKLRAADSGVFFVATFACCQTFLVQEDVPIINYYYGWRQKQSPNFIRSDNSGSNYDLLYSVRPTYVIASKDSDFTEYGYARFQSYQTVVVWKTEHPNVFPEIL